MAGQCVAIMAKEPLPGRVKTRLAATVGAETAAELCEAFLRDTVQTLSRLPNARRCLFFDPPQAEAWFAALDPSALHIAQPPTGFGERLQFGFSCLFEGGHDRVVFIGCDAPHISACTVERALEALERHDLVLGPTDDGGFYLVGLRHPQAQLFEGTPWGTPGVLAGTLERARQANLSVHLLPRSFDIDDGRDLSRLRREFAETLPRICPCTAEVIDNRSV